MRYKKNDEQSPFMREKTEELDSEDNSSDKYERYVSSALILLPPLYFGAPELTKQQWTVLRLVGVAGLFRTYDAIIFTVSIKSIQNDLHISDGEVSFVTSIIQFSAIFSFFLAIIADKFGRKPALLLTIGPFTVLTFLTAFSSSAVMFTIFQFFSRIFCQAEYFVAQVVITEEFDDENRGWGIGALGALGAIGSGIALLLFGVLGDQPNGWRIMYLISVAPMLWLLIARRSLKETNRFMQSQHSTKSWIEPVSLMWKHYRLRFISSLWVSFFLSFSTSPSDFFTFKYLQEKFNYSSKTISILGVVVGGFSVFAYTPAGVLSDRYGRKKLTLILLVFAAISSIAYYELPQSSSGWLISIVWFLKVSDRMAISVLYGILVTELFPTAFRSTARGAVMVAQVVGESLGMVAEGLLFTANQDHWHSVAIICTFQLLAIPVIAFVFPETSGFKLEHISPEPSNENNKPPLLVE